jgi:hypothetical protein
MAGEVPQAGIIGDGVVGLLRVTGTAGAVRPHMAGQAAPANGIVLTAIQDRVAVIQALVAQALVTQMLVTQALVVRVAGPRQVFARKVAVREPDIREEDVADLPEVITTANKIGVKIDFDGRDFPAVFIGRGRRVFG